MCAVAIMNATVQKKVFNENKGGYPTLCTFYYTHYLTYMRSGEGLEKSNR